MDELGIIKIEVKTIYGNELYYPQSHQKALYTLTKTTTLTQAHIHALNALGFKFEIIRNIKLSI